MNNPSVLTVWIMGQQYPVAKIYTHPGEKTVMNAVGWLFGSLVH